MARQTPVNAGFTIVNGSGTGANGDRIDVWAEYLLGQQNIPENYTPITVYFYAALNPAYHSTTAYDRGLDSALKVDGNGGTGVSNGAYSFETAERINALGSFSGHIAHEDDGRKTVTIQGSFTTQSSYISGGFVSAEVALPDIPRASTLGATDADIGKTSVIAVAVKSNAYCHSIAYTFGKCSGFLTADGQHSDTEVKLTNTAIAFVIPESFYDEIPDAPSGQCTLTCKTYAEDTQIGEAQTASFTVTAAQAECGPLLTGTVEDVLEQTLALTGDSTVLIPGYSIARCVIQAQGRKGASIVKMQVSGQTVAENTVLLEQVTQMPVFWVQDSRGYTAQFAPPVTWLDYIPLTNNATVTRDDPTSGNATVQLSGSFYDGSFGAEENALTVAYVLAGKQVAVQPELQLESGTYRGSFSISGLDYTESHLLEIIVKDRLGQVSQSLTVNKGKPVFDWGEGDFRFHVPVQLPQLLIENMTLAEYIRQVIQGGIE